MAQCDQSTLSELMIAVAWRNEIITVALTANSTSPYESLPEAARPARSSTSS